jgi:curved DNA-binding protein CbpA
MTTNSDHTHYQVLNLNPKATYEEIKVAFHKLARQSHPDKNLAAASTTTTTITSSLDYPRIQIAWECLRDADRRSTYDEQLHCQESRSSTHRAITIDLEKDMQQAVDDEMGDVAYVYDCRCGDELQVFEDDWTSRCKTTGLIMECPGCCFVYRIVR